MRVAGITVTPRIYRVFYRVLYRELKQGYEESCSLTTKNVISPPP